MRVKSLFFNLIIIFFLEGFFLKLGFRKIPYAFAEDLDSVNTVSNSISNITMSHNLFLATIGFLTLGAATYFFRFSNSSQNGNNNNNSAVTNNIANNNSNNNVTDNNVTDNDDVFSYQLRDEQLTESYFNTRKEEVQRAIDNIFNSDDLFNRNLLNTENLIRTEKLQLGNLDTVERMHVFLRLSIRRFELIFDNNSILSDWTCVNEDILKILYPMQEIIIRYSQEPRALTVDLITQNSPIIQDFIGLQILLSKFITKEGYFLSLFNKFSELIGTPIGKILITLGCLYIGYYIGSKILKKIIFFKTLFLKCE